MLGKTVEEAIARLRLRLTEAESKGQLASKDKRRHAVSHAAGMVFAYQVAISEMEGLSSMTTEDEALDSR